MWKGIDIWKRKVYDLDGVCLITQVCLKTLIVCIFVIVMVYLIFS